MSAASRGLVRAVRYYQRTLSPRKPAPTCRFTPTCSEYAAQAIERHGALRGGWLAAWRVMRCTPLSATRYDPVPEQFPRHLSGRVQPVPPKQDLQNETSPRRSKKKMTP